MERKPMRQETREVCPTITHRMAAEGALLVDVREPGEVRALAFDAPVIVNMPLSALEGRWSELPRDRELVMVCQSGARSLKAAYFLQFQGYTQISNMAGGILKWMQKGLPVIGQRIDAGTGDGGGPSLGLATSSGSHCC
jgi:rhodanese-related sulfurtransferase